MGAPELLALSLGLSIAIAAFAWLGGSLIERFNHDPHLRERVWTTALILPGLPPVAVALLLALTPAPVVTAAAPSITMIAPVAATVVAAPVRAAPSAVIDRSSAAVVVLGLSGLLMLGRLAALGLRARRLTGLLRDADAASPEVIWTVAGIASGLGVSPPPVIVSAAAQEALLAGLGRPRLLLPLSLARAVDGPAARAVIAHELAHLKRGDHRVLWLEEALLVLLAPNPLMAPLRARRAAAREEACDALALSGAAPETRRAYAHSLIEALRDRAGPRTSGGLPALTFTGAGRTTAMHRLRAVLNPAPAANRGSRLMALGLGGLIVALAGAGSLAVAAEREAVIIVGAVPPAIGPESAAVRMERPGSVAETERLGEQSRAVDLGPDTRTLLNGAPFPEGLPMWAVAAERVDVRTGEPGTREVDLILPFTGTTPVSVNGRRMPTGFPVSGVSPEAVARVETIGDHVMYTLKPEADVRRDRMNARREQVVARMAAESARTTLSSEQEARYRNPTAREYQALCASSDPGDDGFCAEVLFAQMQGRGLCLPTDLDQGAEAVRQTALGDLVTRGKAEIARASIRPGDRPGDVARAALARAYPCETAQEATVQPTADRPEPGMARHFVPLTVTADIEGRPLSMQGDETLRVILTDENGVVMNTHGTINSGSRRTSGPLGPLGMAIAADDFPGAGESTRTYTLTGEIRGPRRALRYVAEPVTIRLAPGARRVDLRPTLSFRPA